MTRSYSRFAAGVCQRQVEGRCGAVCEPDVGRRRGRKGGRRGRERTGAASGNPLSGPGNYRRARGQAATLAEDEG